MAELLRAVLANNLATVSRILDQSRTNSVILNSFAIYVALAEHTFDTGVQNALQTFARQFQNDNKEDTENKLISPELSINSSMAQLAKEDSLLELEQFLESGFSTDFVDTKDMCILHHAATQNNADGVSLLLKHGANVDAEDQDHMRPLMMACRNGCVEAFKVLLNHTTDLKHHDRWRRTALHYACIGGHEECVQGLMERNIPLTASTQEDSELMVSLSHNSENVIQKLIDYGADIHIQSRYRCTLLHSAAKFNCPLAAEIFCQHNVSLSTKDRHGYTALAVAAKNGHIEVMKVLLQYAQQKLQDKQQKEFLDDRTRTNAHAIDLAAMMGHCDCVEALLLAGADINFKKTIVSASQGGHRDVLELLINTYKSHHGQTWCLGTLENTDTFGMSPLHIAAISGHHECVKLLIDEGVNPCQAMVATGETPLMLACRKDMFKVVLELVKAISSNPHKCGLNQLSSNRKTALHYAASLGAVKCAEILLEAGAVPNYRDTFGSTPLLLAAEKGHIDVVRLLLRSKNTDTSPKQPKEDSVLGNDLWVHRNGPAMHAAKHGHPNILSLILDHGANIHCNDGSGMTFLHTSARFDNETSTKELIQRGAIVNAMNVEKQTPLDLALIQGSAKSIKSLVSYNANVVNVEWPTISSNVLCARVVVAMCYKGCLATFQALKVVASLTGEHYREVLNMLACPPSLKAMCKARIRACLPSGKTFVDSVMELPIPPKMYDYIAEGLNESDIERKEDHFYLEDL